MSGGEHIHTAPVLNNNVVCDNVNAEPENGGDGLSNVYLEPAGELESVYPYGDLNLTAEIDGSIAYWDDVGKCLGEGLKPLQNVGEEFGMFDNAGGLGSGMLDCSPAQERGGCLTLKHDYAVVERVEDGNPVHELVAEDGARMSNCGGVEMLGNSLGKIGTVDGSDGFYGAAVDCGRQLTLENEEKPGGDLSFGNSDENYTCVLQVPASTNTDESLSLMVSATEEHVLGESSAQQNSRVQESEQSELSNPDVVLPHIVVPDVAGDGLIRIENAVELPDQLNLQDGPTDIGIGYSSCVVPEPWEQKLNPNQGTGGGQLELRNEEFSNQLLEQIVDSQPQNGPTAIENPEEDSWKDNHDNVSLDSLFKPVQTSNVLYSGTFSDTAPTSLNSDQAPEILGEGNDGSMQGEQSEQKENAALINAKEKQDIESNSDLIGSAPVDIAQDIESNLDVIGSATVDGAQRSVVEKMEKPNLGMSESSNGIKQNLPSSHDAKDFPNEQVRPRFEEITENVCVVVLGIPANATSENNKRGRIPKITPAVPKEKKYALRSAGDHTRVLGSRSQENPEALQLNVKQENTKESSGRKKRRKKETEIRGKSHDEFPRMKKHLRYLLHRIQYEQNLLDAYSSEGWRGQSVEKLRPEKELQRAKADISRSKLKIRNLFQRLDSMSTEGKFPDSLYDSDGLIDSEDIFCAKCGSKDLSTDNDIILCDGACDRGFHQYCLEPPLRTEEIPPGDEGWLCPACDCRADCLDLLNDTQGTKLSIQDTWEKVFPEAAAAVGGSELDDILGLPSDDSEDNDYNPDGTDDAKVKGGELSSDESDSADSDSADSDSSDSSSVSEDLVDVGGNKQLVDLPSDDSEDDDFDPDATNAKVDVEHESSCSDFTSALEDLGAAVDNDGTSSNNELPLPLKEQDEDIGDSPSVSGRRQVERLDYKKLYDETYGNTASDSSDDEEWTDKHATNKGKSRVKKGASVSLNADASAPTDGSDIVGSLGRRGQKKLNLQAANDSLALLTKNPRKVGSSDKSIKRPPYNKLGETVTQRLYESFKENKYPDRETKEKLANELGLTPQRVDKWFGNARWSLNHRPARIEASIAAAASYNNTVHNVACKGVESALADASTVAKNGSADLSQLDANEGVRETSISTRSSKRKKTEVDKPNPESLNRETSLRNTQTNASQAAEVPLGVKRRRRKSGT